MKRSILMPIVIFIMVMVHSAALAQGGPTYDYATIASGSWSSSSTWQGGNVPGVDKTKNIQINHAVTASGAMMGEGLISCANLKIENSGSLTVTNNGRININDEGTGGGIQCSGTGALTVSSGTVAVWGASGTIYPGMGGSATVENVVIEGTDVEIPNVTVTGTLTIKNVGTMAASIGYPLYGTSSTLEYNCGTTDFRIVGKEWKTGTASGAGVPKHVSLSGSKVTLGAGSDYNQMSGNLSIDETSSLRLANELRVGGNFSKADGGTFTHNNITVTFNGDAGQTITLLPTTAAVEFYGVTVDKSSGTLNLSSSSQMTVKNTLTMTKGNIAVGDYAVFLVDDGIISGASASSFFTGRLSIRKNMISGPFEFPVGGGTAYRPVTLYLEASTNTQYSVTLVNSATTGTPDRTTINSLSKQRYWILNYDAGTITKLQVKLIYGAEDGVTDQSTLRIAAVEPGPFGTPFSSIGPTPVEGPPGSGGGTPGVVMSDELTYGEFTHPPYTYNVAFGDAGVANPLPVELKSFAAAIEKRNVVLSWNTATEVNNFGFDVERRSTAGWTKMGFVEGHGTTNAAQSYNFVDHSATGKVAYRLKQIDRDGKFEYSKEVEVTAAGAPTIFALSQNYPNPFNPTTNIRFAVQKAQHATLKVFNMIGQEVATLFDGVAEADVMQDVQFDASKLASAAYIYQLHTTEKTEVKRMILMR